MSQYEREYTVSRLFLHPLKDLHRRVLGFGRVNEIARELTDRVQQSEIATQRRRGIIEMITTILVYKFANLSRREIEQMLGTALQQTRVYQEAKEEGRGEGQRSLILLLLNQKVGALSEETIAQVSTLSPEQLESLAIALLNFNSISDLADWLKNSV